jgi:hypothetical protein
MIVDHETFGDLEATVSEAGRGIGAAVQLVQGLGPQTEEARTYIARLLSQLLEVQAQVNRMGVVLQALREANLEETER